MPQVEVTPDLLDGDLHVIGLTDDGDVIQIDYEGSEPYGPYNSGENLIQWGMHNLRKEEVTRLLSLPIRPLDRQLLNMWHEGVTQEENYDMGIALGYQW